MHKYLSILKTTLFIYLFYINNLHSQCTITSSCGYNIHIVIGNLSIVPTPPNNISCPHGYNYEVQFSYTISISGVNTCGWTGNIGIQPQISCGTQINGNYNILVPAPTVGAGFTTTNYFGTLITSTNQWIAASTCTSSTPASLGCNTMSVAIWGPGIYSATYPCNISTLPIELINFEAEKQNKTIELKWITASEINNDFFTIERAIDGLNFQNIGIVKGAVNSSSLKEYRLSDTNPASGLNYYRLKQTDINKTFKYSQTISIAFNNDYDFSIFPNPLNNNQSLLITLNNSFKSQIELSIYDATGKIVISRFFKLTDQKQIVLENLNLSSGMYVVRLNNDFMNITKKLIIE